MPGPGRLRPARCRGRLCGPVAVLSRGILRPVGGLCGPHVAGARGPQHAACASAKMAYSERV
eukprot:scaffold34221_cov101-Isochrysis_galbana.AAC.2